MEQHGGGGGLRPLACRADVPHTSGKRYTAAHLLRPAAQPHTAGNIDARKHTSSLHSGIGSANLCPFILKWEVKKRFEGILGYLSLNLTSKDLNSEVQRERDSGPHLKF